MLTYPLNKESGRSLYEQLYEGIRRDILSGTLPAHQRLPSKRALAQHLEVSIITVQNAYEQLADTRQLKPSLHFGHLQLKKCVYCYMIRATKVLLIKLCRLKWEKMVFGILLLKKT